jgi:hypothetical protein
MMMDGCKVSPTAPYGRGSVTSYCNRIIRYHAAIIRYRAATIGSGLAGEGLAA